jgi:hypothetical protein
MSKINKKSLNALTVDASLMAVLNPVITMIDAHSDNAAGHELRSRQDGMLRVLIGNFCRDVYQQIHGVKTDKYNFGGIKDSFDKAQNALAQLVSRYANNPEDMDADPNCAKFYTWYEETSAKMEALQTLLDSFQTVYKDVVGKDWEYNTPGTNTRSNIAPADAAARVRAMMKARQAQA